MVLLFDILELLVFFRVLSLTDLVFEAVPFWSSAWFLVSGLAVILVPTHMTEMLALDPSAWLLLSMLAFLA